MLSRDATSRVPFVPTIFPRNFRSDAAERHHQIEHRPRNDRVVEHGHHEVNQNRRPADAFDQRANLQREKSTKKFELVFLVARRISSIDERVSKR